MSEKGRKLLKFVVPLLLVAAALSARVLAPSIFGDAVYLFIYPAVGAAGLIGGFWAGALATTMAMLGTVFFVLPHPESWAFREKNALGLTIFWLSGIAFSVFAARFKSALEEAKFARMKAESAEEQLKAANKRLGRAIEISLGRPGALQDILLDIVDTAIEIAGADFGNVQLIDPETQDLKIVAQRGFPDYWLNYWNSVSKGHGACGTALAYGRRIIVEEIAHSPIFVGTEALEIQLRAGVRAVQSTPLYNRSGQPIGMFSTHYKNPKNPSHDALSLLDLLARLAADAIEQAQLKERLGESEEQYAVLFKKAPVAIALTKMPEQVTVDVNEEFARLFEFSRAEVVGKTSVELGISDPQSRAQVQAAIAATGQLRDFECTRLSKSGASRNLSLNVDKVKVGGREYLLTTVRDITEKRKRESAEESNRIKDLFLKTLSHELRTPLAAILAWAQLVQKRETTESTLRRGLQVIEVSAKALEQLIGDLVDLARIDSGKLVLKIQNVDPIAVIREAVEALRPEAEKKKQILEVSLSPVSGSVRCDPSRMRQVLWNLLSNALKFTPESGRIHVVLNHNATTAVIQVSDTGRGFLPAMAARIFDPFTQGDASTTREFGGLGLGLSLVRSLTELQGGSVRAESPGEGKGATFILEFPFEIAHSPHSNQSESPEGAKSLLGVRILLVEDDPYTREAMSGLLTELGALVQLTASAKEALLKRYLKHRQTYSSAILPCQAKMDIP
jgi:PAS domain S-box-containing protein